MPDDGRCFTDAELLRAGQQVEGWLPLDAGNAGIRTETRELYRPSGAGATRPAEIGIGTIIYAAGLALLAVALWQALRIARHRQAP